MGCIHLPVHTGMECHRIYVRSQCSDIFWCQYKGTEGWQLRGEVGWEACPSTDSICILRERDEASNRSCEEG